MNYIDTITSMASFIAALCAVYLAAVILRERTPMVTVQRWVLGLLAIAMLANALASYEDLDISQGHRPTGSIVDLISTLLLIVMAIRGSVIYQKSRHPPKQNSSDALHQEKHPE